jgi:hypothetical protein
MRTTNLTAVAWRIFLSNPAERLGGRAALVLASGTAVAAVALSRLGVGFDGALDVFRSETPLPLRQALMHQVVAWPATTAIMWTVSLITRGTRRLSTFLGAIGTARLPLLLVGFIGALLPIPQPDAGGSIERWEVLRTVLTAPLFVLFVLWLYQGFRYASSLSGVKLSVSFVLALIFAVVTGEGLLQILL